MVFLAVATPAPAVELLSPACSFLAIA